MLHERHLALLDADECARRAAYRRAEDSDRFALGAVLVRLAAADALHALDPARLEVDRRCPGCGRPHGAPRLNDSGLHLSVSHSGDRVAVAISRWFGVGVDVEQIGGTDIPDLTHHVLGTGESATDADEFFAYWTRKESVVKATGDGLQIPLRDVLVSPPHEPPRLRSYPGRGSLIVSMVDLRPGPGYAGTLTALTGRMPVVVEECAATLLEPVTERYG
jgi:4'-phosphopantetheinyl transferase